jgi:Zn-dependent metalloprotease
MKKGSGVMNTLHQHVCSVIPPHILRHVAEHAPESQRGSIESTITQMEQLERSRRDEFLPPATTSKPATLKKRRNVYDAAHHQSLPGKLVMSDKIRRGSDAEVNEAYDGAGATYDFYQRVFSRNSIDGAGLRLDSTVHYGDRFDNAMWTGQQMVYGDGDGTLFNRFTSCIDVIGHELTHGFTQYTAGLAYTGQAGALNEHVSDAFGIMVKQYALNQTAEKSDWLIGAGLFAKKVKGKAIRSMAAPGTAYDDPILGRDPQPAHMRDYDHSAGDGGGVHINSGIPNHAFYLAATAVGGETWAAIGRIWFVTLTLNLTQNADFAEFADKTVLTAGALYGAGSRTEAITRDAWAQVGIEVAAAASNTRLAIKTQVPEPFVCHAGAMKWRNRPRR